MSSTKPAEEALGATDLFSGLSPRTLRKVADAARQVEHAEGQEITTEGKSGVGFHLILEGTVAVQVPGREPKTLGAGDYFGEISLIDGKPRSATVTTTSPVTTLSLLSWHFEPLLDNEPEVTKTLLQVMCARLRAAEAR